MSAVGGPWWQYTPRERASNRADVPGFRGVRAVGCVLMLAVLVTAGAAAGLAGAQAATEHDAHHPAQANTPAPETLSEGQVRKVDKDAGKITLRHGPIPNLEMPEMTMVFRVKDPAMLDQVKVGDKVRFAAEKIGGLYTITRLETAQ